MTAKRVRLDLELVRRGLAASRSEAKRAIEAGEVLISGIPAPAGSTLVDQQTSITITRDDGPRYVSRGGLKLEAAISRRNIEVAGRRWLDAGASTGGFTDCLLRHGAEAVISLDVGYGQLAWSLRNDPRVTVLERTNVRDIQSSDLPWAPDGVVADLSFISLTLVVGALRRVALPYADFVLLVKPQFEVGRDAVGKGGVVQDPALWRAALERVVVAAEVVGLFPAGAVASPLTGPAGNHEFLLHLKQGARPDAGWVDSVIAEAQTI